MTRLGRLFAERNKENKEKVITKQGSEIAFTFTDGRNNNIFAVEKNKAEKIN